MNSQTQRVHEYLEAGNKIDPLTSWVELGVYRLAPRISDLINKHGVEIQKGWLTVENRHGEKVKVRQYWIEQEAVV